MAPKNGAIDERTFIVSPELEAALGAAREARENTELVTSLVIRSSVEQSASVKRALYLCTGGMVLMMLFIVWAVGQGMEQRHQIIDRQKDLQAQIQVITSALATDFRPHQDE